MSSDQYTPSDEGMRAEYAVDADDVPAAMEEWDAWLAAHDSRVKRDAAREALDGLLDTWGISQTLDSDYQEGYSSGQRDGLGRILTYRDAHYPEETP